MAITGHLKSADPGRVISTRGRFHQNMLEGLVAAAQLTSFQADFKKAIVDYVSVILPDLKSEEQETPETSDKAQRLNQQVMESLQQTHYTLGKTLELKMKTRK